MLPSLCRFHYRELKTRFDLQSQKNSSPFHFFKDIVKHKKRQIRLSFPFENNKSSTFSIKSLSHTLIIPYLEKESTFTIAKFTTSTRIDITLQKSVKKLRAFTMSNTNKLNFRYDKGFTNIIVNMHCPNKMCFGKLCPHKKAFQSLHRNRFCCLQCASICQVVNNPSEKQTNSFVLMCNQDISIFEKTLNSIRDAIEDMYCLKCRNEKCVSISSNQNIEKSFYDSKKCKTSCHVLDNPFMDTKISRILFG